MYQCKDSKYFSHARTDIEPLLHKKYERALEIGCASGQTLGWLKTKKYAQWVGGVEPYASNENSELIDEFWCLDIEQKLPNIPENSIDLLLCLDVLEHLRDPWTTLKNLSKLMKNDAQIIISLPNIRNYRVILNLLFKGDFNYTEDGILDRTHLRFFTLNSAISLTDSAGFKVSDIAYPDINRSGKILLSKLGFEGILAKQFILSARKESI